MGIDIDVDMDSIKGLRIMGYFKPMMVYFGV